MNDKIVEIVLKRLDRIEDKLDTILYWKWSIMGGSAVVAAIVASIGWFLKIGG
jgi:hypothetical protein